MSKISKKNRIDFFYGKDMSEEFVKNKLNLDPQNGFLKLSKNLARHADVKQNQCFICKSKKSKNSGVLVKFPKTKQDSRIDLPTVGLKTLTQCKSAGIKGIVLKSKQNVFLEQKKCISFANKNKMFITIK